MRGLQCDEGEQEAPAGGGGGRVSMEGVWLGVGVELSWVTRGEAGGGWTWPRSAGSGLFADPGGGGDGGLFVR